MISDDSAWLAKSETKGTQTAWPRRMRSDALLRSRERLATLGAIYKLPPAFMPENFPASQDTTHNSRLEIANESPDDAVQIPPAAEGATQPETQQPEKQKLEWRMMEFEGQPMLLAEDAPVPAWYQAEGLEESERRRPAIVFVQVDGATRYRPSWVFFSEQNVHQPLAEVDTSEEAERIVAEYARAFSQSESAAEYQRKEKILMGTAS